MKKPKKLLICYDIDGTLADAGWRMKIAGPEPDRNDKVKYNRWLKKVQNKKMLMKDKPVPGMREQVEMSKTHSIYLTSRSEDFRAVTIKWLKKHKFADIPLHMRKKGDWNSSGKYKAAIILNITKTDEYDVMVFDDDPKGDIFAECQNYGWTFLKALSGS